MSYSKWWMPPRWFSFLLLCYLAGLIIFAVLRTVFLWGNAASLEGAPSSEVLTAYLVGLRFDQIVVLCVLAPVALLLPWTIPIHRHLKFPVTVYFTLVTLVAAFGSAADTRYYHYLDSHLNFLALQYLGQGAMATNLMTSDPWFWPALLLSLFAALLAGGVIYWLFARVVVEPERRPNWISSILYFLIATFFTILGVRGRTALAPINFGAAYFSENHFVNQLALNGMYTFGRTLVETDNDPRLSYMPAKDRFPFVDFETGLHDVQHMLVAPNETLDQPDSSLLRDVSQPQTHGYKPNVILVIMESWSGRLTGTLGSKRNLTPHFDTLAETGILFTDFYASGTRTGYGLGAVLCGFPAIPGRSISNRYDALHPFVTLPEILTSRGYYNIFVYGGDLVFDNVQGFFQEKGMNRFIGQPDFPPDQAFSKWGVPDHQMFNRVVALTDSLPRPFCITALTLSNHEPFALPDSSVRRYFDASDTSKQYNAQIYADVALGQFMHAMRKTAVYDSTIFVFTADHARVFPRYIILDPNMYHIPLLIIDGRNDSAGRRVSILGGQTDIIPTLMGLLGGNYRHASWGRNLLSADTLVEPFAVTNLLPWIGIIEDGFCYAELPGEDSLLYDMSDLAAAKDVKSDHPEIFKRLQRRCREYVQMADRLSTPTTTK